MLFQLVIPSGASVFTSEKKYLLSLETSLWFFALVVEYLCTEAETVTLFEAALLVYLLLYPTCLLGYLLLVLLVYLLLVLLVYMLLYPSFEVPLDCLCGEDRYTVTPQCCPTYTSCECLLVHCYTLPAEYIYCNRPSSSNTQKNQHLRGITINNNIYICFAVRRSVFLSVFNYMLNTSSTQWCRKKIKLKENTYLFHQYNFKDDL